MTDKIGVVGIGHAKFGKRTDVTIRELAYEAVKPALEDAKLATSEIDASVVGIAADVWAAQGSPGALIHDYVGMGNKPTYRVEAACATGSAGVTPAALKVCLPIQVAPHQISEDRIAYKFKPT